MLKEQGGDIEDVLDRNTKCVNKFLSRLRAKLEENTQTIAHRNTEVDEEYMDYYSLEEEMELLYTSPPVPLMALGESSKTAIERAAIFMGTDETRNISVSSPLGSRARAKVLDIQECLIMQGVPSADRIPGRFLQLRYLKTMVDLDQQEVLTTILRHAINDPSECGLSFVLGELEIDDMGALVISIRGGNMRSLQERLKTARA